MKRQSLEFTFRRLSFVWTVAAILITLLIGGLLGSFLIFKDAERQVEMVAESVIGSNRSNILAGGDLLAPELFLKREFNLKPGESIKFVDEKFAPLVKDLDPGRFIHCRRLGETCQVWGRLTVALDSPVYFDESKTQLWGYLHVEKKVSPNWSLIATVVGVIVFGLLFQALGIYSNSRVHIKGVTATLKSWADRMSTNPKDEYQVAPYSELFPINTALDGLKDEIQQLEQIARDQGALVTLRGVGHDLLNPVSRMKRILGLLKLKGGLDEELFQGLQGNLKRLSGYAEQIKTLYRDQSGEPASLIPAVDVSKEVVLLARELNNDWVTQNRSITLSLDIKDDCFVRIPLASLGRIIENLCANSAQASPSGSSVSLKVTGEDHFVVVSVEDSGKGIPDEIGAKIFDAGFTTNWANGTGLGLFVVKQVCDQHGGVVSYDSKPGCKTTFRMRFPRAEVGHGLQAIVG